MAFFCSCKEDTVTNSSNSEVISGTIENWTQGGNIILKAEVYDTNFNSLVIDSTIVSSNGSFSLKLKNVPDSLLYPLVFRPDSAFREVNVMVNPSNTKFSRHGCLIFPVGVAPYGLNLYSGTQRRGWIYRSNNDSLTYFYSFYAYFNQSVTITGFTIGYFYFYSDTAIYNISGVQGWNRVTVRFPRRFESQFNYSEIEPAGGKWIYYWNGNN